MGDWRDEMLAAYGRFHDELERPNESFPGLASFHASERAKATDGSPAWNLSVASEIQELINGANVWGARLHQWRAWNAILDEVTNTDDKWALLDHFIEPLAFYCLHQPSATSDRLARVAENVLHQANLSVDPTSPDRLIQDRAQGMHLRRNERRKQLDQLGARWSCYQPFAKALAALNGRDYREASRNFRNLSVHSIAPRLELGDVLRAERGVGPWSEPVMQPDGGYLMVEQPDRLCVSYAMGVTEPIPSSDAHAINLEEYQLVRTVLCRFEELIEEICDTIVDQRNGVRLTSKC